MNTTRYCNIFPAAASMHDQFQRSLHFFWYAGEGDTEVAYLLVTTYQEGMARVRSSRCRRRGSTCRSKRELRWSPPPGSAPPMPCVEARHRAGRSPWPTRPTTRGEKNKDAAQDVDSSTALSLEARPLPHALSIGSCREPTLVLRLRPSSPADQSQPCAWSPTTSCSFSITRQPLALLLGTWSPSSSSLPSSV